MSKSFFKGIEFTLGILFTVGICLVAVAAWTNLSSQSTGTQITEGIWNDMVAKVNDAGSRVNTLETTVSNMGAIPRGAVVAFYGTTCPSGWNLANGSGDEPKTDGVLGTLDLRGEFIRGLDSGRNIDASRVLGSWQKGSLVSHDWNNNNRAAGIVLDSSANIESIGQDLATINGYASNPSGVNLTVVSGTNAGGILNGNAHGGVTRPRNVALLYCIKE